MDEIKIGDIMAEEKMMYREKMKQIQKLVEKGIPLLLIGEAGMGKSHTAMLALQEMNKEFMSINLSRQTDLVDIVGQYVLKNDETIWVDQPASICAKEGHAFIMEELTMADPTILAALHGLIETPAKLHTLNGKVEVHEDFRAIATANPSWTNYAGVSELNYAFEDRFAEIIFDFPGKKDFEILLKPYTGILEEKDITTRQLHEMGKALFSMYPSENDYYISLRGFKFFCELLDVYSTQESMALAFINKVHPKQRNGIIDTIDTFLPM